MIAGTSLAILARTNAAAQVSARTPPASDRTARTHLSTRFRSVRLHLRTAGRGSAFHPTPWTQLAALETPCTHANGTDASSRPRQRPASGGPERCRTSVPARCGDAEREGTARLEKKRAKHAASAAPTLFEPRGYVLLHLATHMHMLNRHVRTFRSRLKNKNVATQPFLWTLPACAGSCVFQHPASVHVLSTQLHSNV